MSPLVSRGQCIEWAIPCILNSKECGFFSDDEDDDDLKDNHKDDYKCDHKDKHKDNYYKTRFQDINSIAVFLQ